MGRGRGSGKAVYSANQRRLFLELLAKRRTATRMATLARIPVFIWLYWGDEYVPLRQARRAFMTWLGAADAVNKDRARDNARQLLGQLDNPNTTQTARRELVNAIADIAYTGRLDRTRLEQAARRVFEPDGRRRTLGPPAAPITVATVVRLISARLAAVERLRSGQVTDEHFAQARQTHLTHFAEYATARPKPAADAPPHLTQLYAPPTPQALADSCCVDLLTMLGLQAPVADDQP